ncbi:DNA-binding transcriptional regulator [Nocardiopsis sp. MG754419]|nr:transcriptional regulator [Nocardiopsis sp. MG754419]MBR8740279.1 DNA-binding transcriptional regulator [Nocardiopsis sp. MG754419]
MNSPRLLALLAHLQSHPERSGAELADRLGVTVRTVRRDVDRLRELGYPVLAERGTAGYRLGSGAAMPPLLLDDEEAVAMVVGLRTAASVSGIEEASQRALAKVKQVLPARLRHRVRTLHGATVRAGVEPGPTVSADTLMIIAEACRRREVLRMDHTGALGGTTERRVEPHSLVSFGNRWYLVAFDPDRDDWRAFRVDRLTPRTSGGPRFTPREPPHGDPARFLSHRLSAQTWPHRAVVRLHEPADSVSGRLWPGMGVLEAVDPRSCLLHLGAETVQDLVWMITSVHTDFTLVEGPDGLADAFRAQAARCAAAVEP